MCQKGRESAGHSDGPDVERDGTPNRGRDGAQPPPQQRCF